MVDESTPFAIIDNGSGMMKAGMAGEEAPTSVFSSIVGKPKNTSAMQGVTQKQMYIGDEAMAKRGVLNLEYPISAGIVTDWEKMEAVWHHTFFNELRVNPAELGGVLITEAPRNPKANREKMIEVFFENFEVQRAYVALQAVMSLYAVGRSTGIVVDSGDGVTHTVPVFEGFSMPHAIEKMDIAGRSLNDYCQRLLMEAGHNFVSSAEQEIVKAIKESHCYVAQDYEAELAEMESSTSADIQYTLPDKSVITVPGKVRIQTPELIFRPTLNGKNCKSVQDLAQESIQKSDVDVRQALYKNVILSGGTTMYEGLSDRLNKELSNKTQAEVRIVAQPDRKYAVWKGASTLASLSTFVDSMITAEEFQENGAAVVHRKCGGN